MESLTSDLWAAPAAGSPVDADVRVPGSKSMSNRALVLAALADGPSVVRRAPRARDTLLMADALRALGTGIDQDGADGTDWVVRPAGLRGPARVDCGLAGTVMRFVPPVAVLADGDVTLDGDEYARERPMGQLLSALRTLGARIDDDGRDALPFTVRGTGGLPGGTVEVDASASSQYVSGLLLAGARYDGGVSVRHVGKPIPSLPHIEMTVDMLRARGVTVHTEADSFWRVEPGPIAALDCDIEPDLSNAAPFLAAALVTGGRVRVLGWPESTTQAGDALREILTSFGAHVRLDSEGLTVRGGDGIAGVDLDLHDVGELTPVIAALAALAAEPSYLRGIAHIRGHETDRLAGLATELRRLGADATETEDGLEIRPRPLTAAVFHTYDDHRMAHAGAVLGLAVPDLAVENVQTTRKTLPDFVGMWDALLSREVTA